MSYPDYPSNRVIVGGVDISIRFEMLLLDGYSLEPPEPKEYSVDIPGGDGKIDLTESLMGDVAYSNRKQEFTFALVDMQDESTFEERKKDVSNFLHGRAFDYQLTMDPGYTYHGRFKVSSYGHTALSSGILGTIKIEVEAQPYKSRGRMTYRLNATGGRVFELPCGRKKVHPVLECENPCRIRFGDKSVHIGKGSYKLNDVLFEEGYNKIYINSSPLWSVHWSELASDGGLAMTWGQLKEYRWDDIQRLNLEGAQNPQKWRDVRLKRWSEMAETKWSEVDFRVPNFNSTSVLVQYEWKDL